MEGHLKWDKMNAISIFSCTEFNSQIDIAIALNISIFENMLETFQNLKFHDQQKAVS